MSDEEVLTALECRLPGKYGDILWQASRECRGIKAGWRDIITLFYSRVTGGGIIGYSPS